MIEVNNDNILQLVISKKKAKMLKEQIERLFMADSDTGYNSYSMGDMDAKYPNVTELFRIL